MGHIYMIKNKINGKIYIGQTIHSIKERFKKHQKEGSNCRAIYSAIKKYGWKNFEKDWYECIDEDLNKHEKWMVNLMGALSPEGYNLREGGGSRGKHSEESKQKNRDAHTGKTHTDETKQKMSEAHIGKTLSEDHKRKLSESKRGEKHSMFGIPKSEETKRKMSDALRGEKNNRSKKIYQYDLEGKYIQSFASCGEAGLHIKKSTSKISMCACDKRKTAHGFKWSYDQNVI